MSRADPGRVRELFDRAVELSPTARAAFVAEASAGDVSLEEAVASLLRAAERSPEFLEVVERPEAPPVESPAEAIVAIAPGTRVDAYEIEERLGAGGMGIVYRAADVVLGRTVALKFLVSETEAADRARFEQEGRALAAVDHPCIASVLGIGEHEGRPYIAMPFYEGETLQERLRRGPLAVPEATAIVRQIASGLAAAHGAGVLHRDLKPGNVVISPSGSVRLLDFGLARVEAAAGSQPITDSGVVMGSIDYLSPEQLRGERADRGSDLWALGVVAYEMLAGRRPFAATGPAATLVAILQHEPDPLGSVRPDVPPSLAALVGGLLRKDPDDRPADAAAVLALLDGATGANGSRKRRVARSSVAAASIAIALALALGGWFALRPADVSAPEGAVLVLPCRVFGPDDLSFLADAVPSALTRRLSGKVATLAPPRSTEWDPRRADVDAAVRQRPGARCVICTVTAAGNRLTLDVQLLHPGTRTVTWGMQATGTRERYGAMVDDATRGLLGALADAGAPYPPVRGAGSRT